MCELEGAGAVETSTEVTDVSGPLVTSEGLDTRQSCQLLHAGSPWSVTDPRFTDRLARLGLTATDLPALRAAALERTTQTDPHTRKRTAP